MIKVYHTTNWAINSNLHFAEKGTYKPVKSNYVQVASVYRTEELGVAFQKTNHIDTEWWKDSDVECWKESRSTSVGDLLETVDGLFLVAGIGFEKVEWDENDDFIVVHDQYGDYKMAKSEFTHSQWKAYNRLLAVADKIDDIKKLGKKIFIKGYVNDVYTNFVLGPKGKVESEVIE